MARPSRLHIAAVVVGATLGIMVLIVLQVALPILLGLWGLATILVVDLLIAMTFHHRRFVHERTLQVRGPDPRVHRETVHRPGYAQSRDASEKEMATGALLVAVILCVCVAGQALEGAALTRTPNLPLYLVGGAMTIIGLILIDVLFWGYTGFAPMYWNPDLDDTTDDH